MKNLVSPAVLLFICLLSPIGKHALAAEDKTFLWKSEGPTNTVYVLGSIHMASPALYPLNSKIEKAFAESDVLVMESDGNPGGRVHQSQRHEMTYYTDGRTIDKTLSPATFQKFARALEHFNIPLTNIDQVKPWQVAIILSTINLRRSPIRGEFGIDYYFLSKASGDKKIGFIETYDESFNVLAGLNERHQDQFLNYTLIDLENAEHHMHKMVGAWQQGNTESMKELLFEKLDDYPELDEVLKIVYENRNHRMAQRISNLMWDDKNFFVIVGVGHLIGENNVIQKLNSEGYELVRM